MDYETVDVSPFSSSIFFVGSLSPFYTFLKIFLVFSVRYFSFRKDFFLTFVSLRPFLCDFPIICIFGLIIYRFERNLIALFLGKTVENPAFVKAKIPVHMTHFWNKLDKSFIMTIDVKMIGSSFFRKIFWKRYKNRYFFTNRALEF